MPEKDYPALEMPSNVVLETVTIYSLGLALDADIYRPKGLSELDKLPAVVCCHGMGGDKVTAERYAASFAEAGMIALSFSQSSWAGSDGQLIPVEDINLDSNNQATVKVKMIRDLIDPILWIQHFRSAIDYMEGEPNVDADRIGSWGTSYGGGVVISEAAEDDRIKVISTQVPMVYNPPAEFLPAIKQRSIQIARGEIERIPQGIDPLPGLPGTPHLASMGLHRPGDKAKLISVPTQIIDAGNEEFFDTSQSGAAAHQVLKDNGVETYYEVIPGIDHYGIYFDGFERSRELAIDWFQKYL